MINKPDPIAAILVEDNLLEQATVNRLVLEQESSGKSILSMLKEENLITKDQLTQLVARVNKIEFITLSPDNIDPMAVQLVSYDIAQQNGLIPVKIEKDNLYVAMSSPLNLSVRDMIATKTGYNVIPMAATHETIHTCISYHFNVQSTTRQDIVDMRLKSSPDENKKKQKSHAVVSDAPIVRLVDSIITGAIDAQASDIHIEPQEPDIRVRYRIDGILIETLEIPTSAQREVVSHIKILAEMDISEKRVPQDGHITIEHHGQYYDLRVSSLPAVGGEKIVIRILDSKTGLKSLDQIVTSETDYERFSKMISNPYGMILLTGPTGSGKSTTLYSIIQTLNVPERNIVTVEDPVEYRLKGITQVQVKADVGRTFASGLRSILRQDPDVILIGEIRDYETAEIAISSALTGHLVLSTLHTNDAAGAISRLISLGIPSFQVASALLGTVAQRLVRSVCPDCKQPYKPQKEELEYFQNLPDPPEEVKLYRGSGCQTCRDTGYKGRQGVYEILDITPEIRSMIIDGTSDNRIKQQAIESGMRTLRMQGLYKALEGLTTMEELLRVIDMRQD